MRLGVVVVVLSLVLVGVGCGGDDGPADNGAGGARAVGEEGGGQDDAGADSATSEEGVEAEDGAIDVAAVEAALLEDEASPLAIQEDAGPDEAGCMAERLVADMTPEELELVGLPDGFGGLNRILSDKDAVKRLFGSVFDCLDMRPFLLEQLGDLPAPTAECVVDKVDDDADVRVLFILGTNSGSDEGLSETYADELATYDQYLADCA